MPTSASLHHFTPRQKLASGSKTIRITAPRPISSRSNICVSAIVPKSTDAPRSPKPEGRGADSTYFWSISQRAFSNSCLMSRPCRGCAPSGFLLDHANSEAIIPGRPLTAVPSPNPSDFAIWRYDQPWRRNRSTSSRSNTLLGRWGGRFRPDRL